MRVTLSRRTPKFMVAGALMAFGAVAVAAPVSAHIVRDHSDAPPPASALAARTILSGTSHGWSSPDDLTTSVTPVRVVPERRALDRRQHRHPTQSTIVKLRLDGTIEAPGSYR